MTHISRRFQNLPHNEVSEQVRHIRIPGYQQPQNGLLLKAFDLAYSLSAVRQVPADSSIVVTNSFWSPLILPRHLRSNSYVDIQRMPKGQCRWYHRSGRLRANSTPVAEAIREEISLPNWRQVAMIPNPLPFDPPAKLDLHSKQPEILYTGRVHPEKGLDLLMRAAQALPKDWCIRIVGPWEISQGGGGRGYVKQLKQLAGKANITFHGPVFDIEALSEFYRRASVFVYPSVAEKGETFGLSPLEAMAWGCAPVVSNLLCFKDFIVDGLNGCIFDHSAPNAVEQLLQRLLSLVNDPCLRERMAEEATGVRVTHAPRRIAELFVADFERVTLKQGK